MRKKLFSMILCVIMVICFMPSVAFAYTNYNSSVAEEHAEIIDVVNGNSIMVYLKDGYCLRTNDATSGTEYTEGEDYVARYSSGTLYLKGYNGVNNANLTSSYAEAYGIYNQYLKIVVESDSSLSVTNNGTGGSAKGLYCGTLDLSGEGKLTINVTNNVGIANGINASYTSVMKISSPINITVSGKSSGSGADVSGIVSYAGTTNLVSASGIIAVTSKNGTSEHDANGVFCYDGNFALGRSLQISAKTESGVTCNNVFFHNASKTNVTSGTFNFNPNDYVEDGYIVKRSGTEGEYTFDVVEKTDLGEGTYCSNPENAVASGYTAKANDDGTYTVSKKSTSSSGGSSYVAPAESSGTGTSTGSVVNTTETKTDAAETGSQTTTTVPETKATVAAETKTAEDGTKTTTATVDTAVATQIVEMAVENKSEEVIIAAAETPVVETAAGTTTEVAIPAETVSQIAEKTAAAVTIESEAAKVTLDQQAVAAVAEAAGETGNVSLVVETKAQDENKVEVELKLETSSGKVSDFKGGSVSVTVKLNSALADKTVACVYIDDNGNYHKVAGQKNDDGTFTFTTGHFSTYAIMSEEEADAVIEAQTEKVTELLNGLTIKARSSKTNKGNIKVTLKVNKKTIKAIKNLGYTVTYKFSRSTKAASAYKAKAEKAIKTYTDKSGKKGIKYYYKARVMVYDAQGTLIAKTTLKQCKYASRVK